MNARHKAALALVAWYLMLAPAKRPFKYDADAATKQWKIVYVYSTRSQCEAARLPNHAYGDEVVLPMQPNGPSGLTPMALIPVPRWATKCVASNDARFRIKVVAPAAWN
jgi:hypothetical protein